MIQLKKLKRVNELEHTESQASFSLNVSLLLRKPISNSGQNPILRSETSNAAAIASDSGVGGVGSNDISDELNLSHDGNGGKNCYLFLSMCFCQRVGMIMKKELYNGITHE